MYKKLFILVSFAFAGLAVNAQHPGQVGFWHLTPNNGLSQSTGKAILQDYKGYMWIGTQDGLNKYNGHEMTVYKFDENDSTSIGYDDISCLIEDSNNNLLIGTLGGGLNIYNRNLDNFTRLKVNTEEPEKGLSDNTVFSLIEDRDGNLWIGTNNGLNFKASNADTIQHIFSDPDNPNTISHDYIEKLFEDNKGNIWIGTINGLNKYNPETDTFTSYTRQLGDDRVYEIMEDVDGTLWIGTGGGGLIEYDYKTDTFKRHRNNPEVPTSIADNSIFSVFEDSRGVLWIGTENHGLDVYDRENNEFLHYTQNTSDPASLNNNAVYTIYENNDQLLWVGTFAGGLNILDRKTQKFEHFQHNPHQEQSLSTNSVLSFLEDHTGNFWVGTDGGDGGGLNLFDRQTGSFIAYRHDPFNPNTIPSDVILEMLEDNKGNLWLGTYNGGVSRFDYKNHTFKHYQHNQSAENGLSQNHIFALMLDSKGQIWAGTNGEGVDILGPDRLQFKRFGHDSVRVLGGEINISHVRSFLEDKNGHIWIGTYGTGAVVYNPESRKFSSYHIDNSNINNSVIISIHEDRRNRIWLGTKGGGLNLFDRENEEFDHINTDDGLPSDVINGILEDEKGNFWLSTHNGISKFNSDSMTFNNYGLENGLQSREFNPGAAYKDRAGYFYFGGINGFNRFHPDSIKVDSFVHPLALTDFEIFNNPISPAGGTFLDKQISETDEIVLSYRESVLTFEYATLNFNRTKGNTYAYKMEGFDPDWNFVGDRRTATYTNLDAGEYTFRVKAANSDNVWGEEASLRIVITPPFWETAWFYIIVGILLAGAILGGFRYRTRQITEQNKRLEEEVRNRTSELNQRNSELKQTLADLENTRQELIEKAHKAGMADIAIGVLHNVGNILNSVNASSALIEDTIQKSKLEGLTKANDLLREHIEEIESFITKNPKGKKLFEYYLKLEAPLKEEQEKINKLSKRLIKKIQLINEVILAQQSYATTGMNAGEFNLAEIVDDTLMLNAGMTERHAIDIEKNYDSLAQVICQRSKLIHVLVNIFKNAKEAMTENDENNKNITIDLSSDENFVYLSISDTGHGITKENLGKIFNQGFTTKKNGHGFGLHSSANYIKEMGAEIFVDSKGEGKGAVFTLKFNRATKA